MVRADLFNRPTCLMTTDRLRFDWHETLSPEVRMRAFYRIVKSLTIVEVGGDWDRIAQTNKGHDCRAVLVTGKPFLSLVSGDAPRMLVASTKIEGIQNLARPASTPPTLLRLQQGQSRGKLRATPLVFLTENCTSRFCEAYRAKSANDFELEEAFNNLQGHQHAY